MTARTILATFALLGLMMAGMGTASAVSPRGDCGCTEQPPFCDPGDDFLPIDLAGSVSGPDKPLILADGKYITDEDGAIWYCEKGECTFTGIYVEAHNKVVTDPTGRDNYMS